MGMIADMLIIKVINFIKSGLIHKKIFKLQSKTLEKIRIWLKSLVYIFKMGNANLEIGANFYMMLKKKWYQ